MLFVYHSENSQADGHSIAVRWATCGLDTTSYFVSKAKPGMLHELRSVMSVPEIA